jgi:hypothetical protein
MQNATMRTIMRFSDNGGKHFASQNVTAISFQSSPTFYFIKYYAFCSVFVFSVGVFYFIKNNPH